MNSPYFKAWLIFFLICSLGSTFVGTIIGVMTEAVLTPMGASEDTLQTAGATGRFIAVLFISYFSYRWTLRWFILPRLESHREIQPESHRSPNLPSVQPGEPYRAPNRE